MRHAGRHGALVVLLLLGGCGLTSPATQRDESLATVHSWLATAQLVGADWARGDLPDAYTRQTLQTAQQQIQAETTTLAQTEALPADQRAPLIEQLQQAPQQIGQLLSAVEQHDRVAALQQAQQLSADEQRLEQLARQIGAQP